MLFSKNDTDKDTEDKGAAKKLGLSKIVYGLGMSARDALVTFVASTAVAFAFIYKGQDKGGMIEKMAHLPDRLHTKIKEKLGVDRAGKAGKALLLAAGVGTVVSWVAHLPGLVRGPQKVAEAEEVFNNEVSANVELSKENSKLTEALKRKDLQIADLEKRKGSFVERVAAQDSANGQALGL